MGGVHQALRDLAWQARQADVEAGAQEVTAAVQPQVHLGVDGPAGGQGDLPLAGGQPDRAQEARRPAGGEQLLWVGALAGGAWGGELDVEASVRAARAP